MSFLDERLWGIAAMFGERGTSMGAGLAARYLPGDFVEASRVGGVCTIVVWLLILIGFAAEMRQLLNAAEVRTSVELVREDDKEVSISFDIDMLDIECRNLRVMVFDEFGSEPISTVATDFWFQSVDAKGKPYGAMKTAQEPDEQEEMRALVGRNPSLDLVDSATKELLQDLYADWLSTHDGFEHLSFKAVIDANEFTLINFFIDTQPCADFSHIWRTVADLLNGDSADARRMKVFTDRDGASRTVRAIKVNCKEFSKMCTAQGVDAYPSVRLYKKDEAVSVFEGKHEKDKLMDWIQRQVRMKAYGWAENAESFERGCKAKGSILVPRVPGHFELLVGGGDQSLNPFMTNVSHRINHLAFEDPDARKGKPWVQSDGWPSHIREQISPLNGRTFLSESAGWAWVHDIKAVGTKMRRQQNGIYQVYAGSRVAKQDAQFIPQASFNYDIEPFTITVYSESKGWTDLSIRWLATTGGIYVTFRMFTRFVLRFSGPVERTFKPQSGGLL